MDRWRSAALVESHAPVNGWAKPVRRRTIIPPLIQRQQAYFSESRLSRPASKKGIRGLQKMFGAIFSGKSAPEIMVWRPLHFVSAPMPHLLPSSVVREDEPLLVAS